MHGASSGMVRLRVWEYLARVYSSRWRGLALSRLYGDKRDTGGGQRCGRQSCGLVRGLYIKTWRGWNDCEPCAIY